MRESLEGITDLDYVIAQYDGEITYADAQAGRLLDFLDTEGLANGTLVIINGDHGEALGEHEVWFDHGDDLYDASTRVPMVMRFPGRLPQGLRVRTLVELTDLAPTVLELLGLPVPDSVDGRPLGSIIDGKSSSIQARGFCFDRVANLRARAAGEITKPRWRMASLRSNETLFVRREAPAYGDEYYDMALDPSQEVGSLALLQVDNQGLQLLQFLRQETDKLLEDMGEDQISRTTSELSAEQQSKLRALGYLE